MRYVQRENETALIHRAPAWTARPGRSMLSARRDHGDKLRTGPMNSASPHSRHWPATGCLCFAALLFWLGIGGPGRSHAAPPRPAHDLWVEGESCTDHNFTVIGRDPAFAPCYDGAILQLQTRQEAPPGGYHATFRTALPTAGWWELRLAITRTGVAHLSPFTVEVTGYAPRRVCDFPVEDPYGPGDIFAWLTFGCLELPAGEVAVTIRCDERRPSENDYLVYIDALAWRAVPAPTAEGLWIAGPTGAKECLLKRSFACIGLPRHVVLTLACEGTAEVAVNGAPLGRATAVDPATVIPLPAALLKEGENTLSVRVRPTGPDAGLLAWLSAAGERGARRLLVATDESWRIVGEGGEGPVRVLGHARRPPWGDLTVQPVPRIPAGRLPIPVKTGNLSVDLIMAAAKGQPRPEPHASPEFDRYRDLASIGSVEDYLCWLPLEPERDQLRWEYYERNATELELRGMGYTVYPWLHFVPDWVLHSEFWEPLRCLDHDDTTFAPSIWSPATLALFDRFYGALRKRLGSRVKGIYVSMVCDYGEVGYPVGMADWVVPAAHKHPGFWCGDARARQDFRESALKRYGTLAGINAAWGTAFAEPTAIAYPPWTASEGPPSAELQALPLPARTQARRRWLDFVDWYQQAMVDFAAKAVAVSRRHYPDTPHEVKIGFGSERVMYGADYTAFVARSQADSYTVRSTHGKLEPYFYRRFSSAARHYGVPLVTEPPSGVSRDEEVERIFKDAISGTTEYFDYPQNLLDASDLFARFGIYLEGQHSLTAVAFFFPTTDHRLRAGQHLPTRLKAACDAATDRFDYSILDERLVRAGALARERLLILVEGNVIEADVLERIQAWVEEGGVLLAARFGEVETVEGDTVWAERCLLPLAGLPPADSLCTRQAKPLAAGMIDVGSPSDEGLLSGDWNPRESGHWEWGGEPGAVSKRWSGADAGIWLAVDPTREIELALAVALHPKRLQVPCEVRINGTRLGTVSPERTSIFRARVGPGVWAGQTLARLQLVTEAWQPSLVDGSTDTRRLGVAVNWVKWWLPGTPEPEQAPVPTIQVRLDLHRVAAACVRRLGRGATVRTPFGPGELGPFLELAAELACDPGRIVAWAAPGAPRLDGVVDRVWCALLPHRILFCNTGDHEVHRELTLDPEALRRAGAAAPATPQNVSLTLTGHTLTSVELPSGEVLAP
jgi:hypothetical protein